MMKRNTIMKIGAPWIIPGIVLSLIVNFAGGCEFKEPDYLLSSYYNQTHATFNDAKKYCNNINDQLGLIGLIMLITSLISIIIGIFPDGPKNENLNPHGTLPKGFEQPNRKEDKQ